MKSASDVAEQVQWIDECNGTKLFNYVFKILVVQFAVQDTLHNDDISLHFASRRNTLQALT